MSAFAGWASIVRLSLADLGGGARRFVVLVACIALGVGTIAAVGSVGAALQAAIDRDARVILGGDLEVIGEGDISAEQRAALEALGPVVRVVSLSSRAAAGESSVFVSVQAVSSGYPLAGTLEIAGPDGPVAAEAAPLLAATDGMPGAVVDDQVLVRLGLSMGDTVRIGNGDFVVRGVLAALPDQAGGSFQLGLPVLISDEALAAAGLDQPGVLTDYDYKIALDTLDFDEAEERLRPLFPEDAWRIRSPQDATAALERFFGLFARFLVLVGLSSLLVGGVGVSNAVAAYVTERQGAIATLRSLGATRSRIFWHFLVQVMLLALAGVAIGLALGAGASTIALPTLSGLLAIALPPTLDLPALATAAGFGLLVAFAFSLLPLRRAQTLQPAALFRAGSGGVTEAPPLATLLDRPTVVALVLALAAIAALALLVTGRPELVFWYAVGAAVAFALLRGAALLLQAIARRLPPARATVLRHAVRALHRPGAPAPVVVLSLGLGLALLLMIALLDGTVRGQLAEEVAREAPDFVFIDMTAEDAEALSAFGADHPGIDRLALAPMLRGTITEIDGEPASAFEGRARNVLSGDTPLTWSAALPETSTVAEGEWWPAGYDGKPLISLEDGLKQALDLEIGETLTIAISGREITFTVASFRTIDWRSPGFNFVIVASPGVIEAAPQSRVGTLYAAPGEAGAVEAEIGRTFPNLLFVPVGEVIEQVNAVLGSLSNAVALVGSLALVSGIFVLSGAISVGRRQREADAMVMKVLGATRRDVLLAYLVEYGVLGLLAAVLAVILGSAGAWAITVYVLEIEGLSSSYNLAVIAAIAAIAVAATIATGMLTTWSALSVRPAEKLRAEGF